MTTVPPPTLTVVIPTFNRVRQLTRTLGGLRDQVGLDHRPEIVVVDDGSTDGTAEWLGSGAVPVPVVAISQQNAGPAAARNRGVEEATGDIVLFLDDDVVPMPDLLAAHLRRHAEGDGRTVVVGPMNTPTDADMSPWVRWEQKQLDKQYEAMLRGDWEATPRQFYTGNASLRRCDVHAAGGFDTTFRRAEDVELAYRLDERGLRFVFAPDAAVLHYAQRSFPSWRATAVQYGRNDVIFGLEHDRQWLLDSFFAEFHHRHRLVRWTTRATLSRPLVRDAVLATLAAVTRILCTTGPRRLTDASLSALFNLEYYHGMAEQLGGDDELSARLDAAAAR